jgi:hypothetical protein
MWGNVVRRSLPYYVICQYKLRIFLIYVALLNIFTMNSAATRGILSSCSSEKDRVINYLTLKWALLPKVIKKCKYRNENN